MKTETRRGMSGVVLMLAVITVAMLPETASAQDETFMLVPGISGGSRDAHHPGWIDVVSLRQSWSAAAKKRESCEIEIVKGLDKAGPRLWAAAVLGQALGRPIQGPPRRLGLRPGSRRWSGYTSHRQIHIATSAGG